MWWGVFFGNLIVFNWDNIVVVLVCDFRRGLFRGGVGDSWEFGIIDVKVSSLIDVEVEGKFIYNG